MTNFLGNQPRQAPWFTPERLVLVLPAAGGAIVAVPLLLLLRSQQRRAGEPGRTRPAGGLCAAPIASDLDLKAAVGAQSGSMAKASAGPARSELKLKLSAYGRAPGQAAKP